RRQSEDALIVAEKIRQNLSQPLQIEGLTLSISLSIGLAVYPEHGEQSRQLMCHADTAMYKDKKMRH
ncbi:diguanylate cyclase domain-containing protein, partial [Rhizobium johnstonii]|uniref:diguanylate cyclase domain-containing protein n=1 Tax=Rhizobium johnstonii TaxID=3019933 RepID=UPI003F992469